MDMNELDGCEPSNLFVNLDRARDAARRAHKRVVLIAESGNQARILQRQLAANGRGFGVAITTLRSWVAELWALYGDGRQPVSPEEATVRLLQLVQQADNLAATPGILNLVTQAADQALPLAAITDNLSSNEMAVAQVLLQYAQDLEAANKIAYPSMLMELADATALARYQPLCLVARDELSVLEHRFLDAAEALYQNAEPYANSSSYENKPEAAGTSAAHSATPTAEAANEPAILANEAAAAAVASMNLDAKAADEAFPARSLDPANASPARSLDPADASPARACRLDPAEPHEELRQLQALIFNRLATDGPIKATGQVRVALASGVEAQRRNVHHALQDAIAAGCRRVTVVAPNALAQWRFSAPALQHAGATCTLRCRKAFTDIDAGRALLDLCALVTDDRPDTMLDADYAFNPLAGIPYSQAFHLDMLHRGNRLITNSEVLSDLAGNAPDGLEGVINLAENDDLATAVSLLTGWTARHYANRPGYLTEQLAALGAAARLCEAAAACGVSQRAAIQTLEGRAVTVDVAAAEYDTPCPTGSEQTAACPGSNGKPAATWPHDNMMAPVNPTAHSDWAATTAFSDPAPAGSATTVYSSNPGKLAAAIGSADCEQTSACHPASRASLDITFTTMATAAEAAPGSADAVIFAQLNAANYPVRNSEDSLGTLLGKWGLAPQTDAWAAARRRFTRALRSARKLVVLQRATHDENADEAQAAVVFEEALNCYRQDPNSKAGMDPVLHIPETLMPYALTDGEERFVANTTTGSRRYEACPAPVIGRITPEAQPLIVLPRTYGNRTYPGLDVSASQIESYLECPYQWFAKRRLKLETVEEGFSALERGSFMHAIMERFYRHFQEQIGPKVTVETLPAAREVMQTIFTEQAERQFTDPNLKPGVRYVPVNSLEEKERDRLLPQLQQYLDLETRLLPAFQPRYFEWAFGQDRPFSYAGCNLTGAVDRIDVDADGNAVIIDYKSSLSPAYRLHLDPDGKQAKDQAKRAEAERRAYMASHGGLQPPAQAPEFQLPAKMQALIYAKVVRDTLGLNVVASLYLNPTDGRILGAYDAQRVGAEQVPFRSGADARACAVPFPGAETFDELIAACEDAVAERMAQLAAGTIFPHPHGPDACRYCPVGNCPQRLEERRL